jgi:AcrR family transcriptional regulator
MEMVESPSIERARGRPRDSRIDRSVLDATIELLGEVGYQRLTIPGVAARAGTTPPTVYRRWPTKAHLVHEAVFPATSDDLMPACSDLRGGIRAMLVSGVQLLNQPAARAAVPGLLAELSTAPGLHADILEGFAGNEWMWLHDAIRQGIEDGQVRPGVEVLTLIDVISGAAFLASLLGPPERVDDQWVEEVVELIIRGITPERKGGTEWISA